MTLSWNAVSGASQYTIYRSTTQGTGHAPIDTSSTNSFIDLGVTNGTTYYYVVTATANNQESGYSNEASATPSATAGAGATEGEDDDRHCGLVGIEALLALGLLALIRRK